MRTAGNDDKSPLIDLISCVVCNKTMKLEKSSPDAEQGTSFNIAAACAAELNECYCSAEVEIRRTESEVKIEQARGAMISVLIGVLIIAVVGEYAFGLSTSSQPIAD